MTNYDILQYVVIILIDANSCRYKQTQEKKQDYKKGVKLFIII